MTAMRALFSLLVAVTVCACANEESTAPDVIAIGVLPGQSQSGLATRYGPLVSYLQDATGLVIELSIPANYEQMLDEFDAGRIHIANFGGVTFTQAEQRSGAVPLVMRDVDLDFISCYIVRDPEPRRSVNEFEGEAFSFGPKLSTSGHMMPRHFLEESGITPEDFFASVRHSSGHDQTVDWVLNGTIEIGVANCLIVQSLLSRGSDYDSLRVLETTPPYGNYVWAAQSSLDASVTTLLTDAFLALDPTNAEHLAILRAQGANGYVPAGRNDFEAVRAAAREAGQISDER